MSTPLGEIRFREATLAHQPAIIALIESVLQEYGLPLDPGQTDADLRDLQQHYFARGGYFELLIDEAGTLWGCWALYPLEAPHECELRKMYFHPAIRGRGLGKQCMQRFIDKARALGYRRAVLDTASVLKEAIGLYRRFGFKEIQDKHLPDRCDIAMELLL